MKTFSRLMGFSLILFSTAFGANTCPSVASETKCCGYYLDVNIAYFRPNASVLREIYSSAWGYAQVNFDATVARDFCCNTSGLFWSAVGIMYQEGYTESGSDACYRAIPFTLGGKLNYNWCNWDLYAGLGMRFFFTRFTDCSGYVDNEIRKTAFGGAASLGARYLFSNCLYFHTFVDYSFQAYLNQPDQQMPFVEGSSLDVSGLAVGAGIGVKF